ncbi:MAG: hypothetical protein K6B51_06305 [Bacilli bacterium]|nr:hypothetical protein [Bacilli bacterium]
MLKKTFSKLLGAFSVCLVCLALNRQTDEKRSDIGFNASIADENVVSFVEADYGRDAKTFLGNISSVYFSNLRSNFGINSHGSCSFVSVGMLLSFYDTFWNDSLISDEFDACSFGNFSFEDAPNFVVNESPGIKSENINQVLGMSSEEYSQYITENSDDLFQCFLIDYAWKRVGPYGFEDGNPFGLTTWGQTELLNRYLVYERGLNSSNVVLNVCENDSESAKKDFIRERVMRGVPVVLNFSSETFGRHSVVAYDYNAVSGDFYVHTGWKTVNGYAATHVSFDSLRCSKIESAIALDVRTGYAGSDNYLGENNLAIIDSLAYPRDVVAPDVTFFDVPPTITWKSAISDYCFSQSNAFMRLSVKNGAGVCLCRFDVVGSDSFTFALDEWNDLTDMEDDSFIVSVSLVADYLLYSYDETNHCDCNLPNATFYGEESELLPVGTRTAHLIKPSDYRNYKDSYATEDGVDSIFCESVTEKGFAFKTRRFRAGYIQKDSIVLSPIRKGFNHAFVEYSFFQPIARVDIDLSFWRSREFELWVGDSDFAAVETLKFGVYSPIIDLLSPENALSEDRTSKTRFHLIFPTPVMSFRIYSSNGASNSNESNRGRISIGQIAVYESDHALLPVSGFEKPYEPAVWNDPTIMGRFNCYAYALNAMVNYTDYRTYGFDPGELSNYDLYRQYNYNHENFYDYPLFWNLIKSDSGENGLTADGYYFEPISKDTICPAGTYKVALAFDLNGSNCGLWDYHWFRQNPDGTWSHKPGPGEVVDFDGSGDVIVDPECCDRRIDGHNYSIFIGFYAVQGFDLAI